MSTDDLISRVLRWTGWITWLAVGFPIACEYGAEPAAFAHPSAIVWAAAFIAFGPALAISSTRVRGHRWDFLYLPALVVGTVAPLMMIGLNPECFAGALLVIVAWQVSVQLPAVLALTWVVMQSLILSAIVFASSPNSVGISDSIIFTIFQLFAFCTAFVTRKEMEARSELVRTNSYLKSTRLLLSQSIRISERARISRDLHDVLGHDLTAISLHLEIAQNTQDDQRDVARAQDLAKGMLVKVREVVSLMRVEEGVSILPMLRELAELEPQLKIHIDADQSAECLDPKRAHALLRCIQETITNARVHSGASNLWLTVRREGDSLLTEARDDGKGMATPRGGGNGLKGMDERLREFGGSVIVDPAPGKGFALSLTLPLGQG